MAARRADGLWIVFGWFDRTTQNQSINSPPSTLCPLCPQVAHNKTGGEKTLRLCVSASLRENYKNPALTNSNTPLQHFHNPFRGLAVPFFGDCTLFPLP